MIRFLKTTSLRKKIILPFVFIMAITSVIFMFVSIHFISNNIEKRLNSDLERQNLAVRQNIDIRLKRTLFYAQLISDMKIVVDPVPNIKIVKSVKNIFFELANQDRTTTYLSLNYLTDFNKKDLAELTRAGYQGKSQVMLYLKKESNSNKDQLFAIAVGSVKNEGFYYPTYAVYPFDNVFLEDIKSRFKTDLALIYFDKSNKKDFSVLAGTNKYFSSKSGKNIFKYLITHNNKNIQTVKILGYNYKIILQPLDLNPQIYLAVLLKNEELTMAKQNIIFVAILGFVGITVLMILIYFYIIRRITRSIDELSAGIKKVSAGNLDHQVQVTTHDEIGNLAKFFNAMILNLKESRQNLINEKDRSEAIIANIPEGIIVTDSENKLILANQKAEQMFNFALAEVQGKFILECINNPELLETIKEQLNDPDKIFSKEIQMLKENHKKQFFVLTFSMAHNKIGQPIGVITVLRDITHDKELEELRESFLRTVSHELRTPLTSIIGFIELLFQGLAGNVTTQQKEYLNIALKQSLYLKELINNLLDLSRIEAGKIRMLYSEINLHQLFLEVANTLKPIIKEKPHHISLIISPTKLKIIADIEKLRRILINLVSNAVKFTEEGSITLSVTEEEDDNSVIISIKDTGIGLTEEESEIIFDKFCQIDSSSTRAYEGLGLGLPIAKELVELHNGKIWVESEYMKGADFKFKIPKKPN